VCKGYKSKGKGAEILHIAVSEARMVITMDKDFGELVYNSGLKHSGVLILRLEDADGNQKLEVVKKILSGYADRISEQILCISKWYIED